MSEIIKKAASNEVVQLLYNDLRQRVDNVPSAENIVMVQDQQPTVSANKVWLTETPPPGVDVPTYGEFTGVIAPDYADLDFPVSAGEHCIHNGVLYTAIQNINASEAWTAAHWEAGSVSSKLTEISNDIEGIKYLESTNDSTDRTAEIVAQLTEKGYCALGKGYFIAKNIIMPDNSVLYGLGKNTRLIMDASASGALISVGTNCEIKDLWIDGLTATVPSAIGNRDGIYLGEGKNLLKLSNIRVCQFKGSGIHVYKTGYGQIESCQATNIDISKCFIGLYLDEKAEYGTYNNITCKDCNTGVRNDGGNNLFSSCGFNSNTAYGYFTSGENIENSNNGHGACVGCSFNHNNIGIYFNRNSNGFAFSGCEIMANTTYDADIWITGGITFCGCNFAASAKIRFAYGACNLISGCMFSTVPTITLASNNVDPKVTNSFISNTGNEVVLPT